MIRHYTITFFLLFIACLLLSFTAADQYKAFNYKRANGLPGNKVYYLYQDSRNYIWMATENGLVYFNGYEFKTYTVKDGLPDNEIIYINEDRSGKLWLVPFSNEVCYIWKGKIYNSDNDPVLKKIKLTSLPKNIVFDRWGNTWISEVGSLRCINAKGEVAKINKVGNDTFKPITPLRLDDSGRAIIVNETKYYRHNGSRFELMATLPIHPHYRYNHGNFLYTRIEEFTWTPLPLFIKRYTSGKNIYYQGWELNRMNIFKKLSKNLVSITSKNGACLKNTHTGKTEARFLEGYNVSDCLLAKDGSLWFGTLGNGAFHYFPSFIKSIPIDSGSTDVSFIKAGKDGVYCILDKNVLMKVNTGNLPDGISKRIINTNNKTRPYTYMGQDRLHNWIVCESDSICLYTAQGNNVVRQINIEFTKDVFNEDDHSMLIGTTKGIYRLDKDEFRITDTFYDNRVTTITKVNKVIYAGTLNGLLAFSPDKKMMVPFREEPMLKTRITALCADADSILWVANNKGSLIRICNNRIRKVINRNTSLEYNSISSIKASDKYLWVGTDNGLYVVNKKFPFNVIRHLSFINGLNNNQINCLEIAYGKVWVGTENGLNYFDEKMIVPLKTQPTFFISSIHNDETNITPVEDITDLKGKTLRINFDVVDHEGATKPVYAYRLNDNNWVDIERNSIHFPAIPYGNFTIFIKAVSSNWDAPQVLKLSFHRAYPFYLSWWFILIAVFLFLVLLGGLIRLFLKRVRRKDKEQLLVQQNLLQLEQMALQGQMNPHFIFNCITAIRQYYNKGDILKANRFVDIFSALIRTTFEMVNQAFTSLEHELNYLNQYLIVEQERFNHTFTFSITKEIHSAASSIPVPAMLLQPLVENAVRHGVRHLPDGTGKINIAIVQLQGLINITVEDNGIGVAKTQSMKQLAMHTTSVTSTSVNKRRISILNKLFDNKIGMTTEDIMNEEGHIAGTKVFISYPLDIYVFEQ